MENIFKDKLKDFGEVPPAHVWEGIVKKRGPLHIWWHKHLAKFAAVYILSMVIIGGVIYYVSSDSGHSVSTELVKQESTVPANIPSNDGNTSNNELPVQNESINQNPDRNSNQTVKNSKPASSISTNPDARSNNPVKFKKHIVDNEIPVPLPEGSEYKFGLKSNYLNIDIQKAENSDLEGNSIVNNPVEEADNEEDITMNEPLVKENNDILPPTDKGLEAKAKQTASSPKVENTLHPLHGWHIQVQAGPYWANRVLKGSNAEWIELRNQSESMKAGWFVAATAGKSIGNGWELNGGLSFFNRSEILNYSVKHTEKVESIRETWVTTYHPILPPSTQLIRDTFVTEKTSEQELSKRNSYRVLSIPLYVRYQYYLNYWSFSASAGVNADIRSWTEASILNEQSKITEFSDISKSQSLSGRAIIGIGVGRKAGNHWRGMLEPTVFIPLNNQFNGTGWGQKDFGLSINGGIRYEF